ncbi:MAG: hypothetical protein GF368_00545 [Candidatus Aenigmarchaeota archaeon]|nr:hypothetical protein [Candidatus Aenigmarchaeota archaeon]
MKLRRYNNGSAVTGYGRQPQHLVGHVPTRHYLTPRRRMGPDPPRCKRGCRRGAGKAPGGRRYKPR